MERPAWGQQPRVRHASALPLGWPATADYASGFGCHQQIGHRGAQALPQRPHAISVVFSTIATATPTSYTLTGPEALSAAEVAERLSAATGRQVRYVDIGLDAFRQALARAGLPGWLVDGLVETHTLFAAGHAATVTDEVAKVTGWPHRRSNSSPPITGPPSVASRRSRAAGRAAAAVWVGGGRPRALSPPHLVAPALVVATALQSLLGLGTDRPAPAPPACARWPVNCAAWPRSSRTSPPKRSTPRCAPTAMPTTDPTLVLEPALLVVVGGVGVAQVTQSTSQLRQRERVLAVHAQVAAHER